MFKARVIQYEVWGNEEDGFDVNNLFEIAKVKLNGDYRNLSSLEIIKRLKGKPCHARWTPYNLRQIDPIKIDLRKVAIDNSVCSDNMIEIIEKRTGKPVGRIELSDESEA